MAKSLETYVNWILEEMETSRFYKEKTPEGKCLKFSHIWRKECWKRDERLEIRFTQNIVSLK